jgi:hypothetical protein
MRKFIFIIIAIALAASACQNDGRSGKSVSGGNHAVSNTGEASAGQSAGGDVMSTIPCRPTSIAIYDDFSKSVNNDIALGVKKNFVESLERDYVPCLVSVRLVRFGVGSVWSAEGKRYNFPATPSCGEPDYHKLPAPVRNLTAYRDQFRRDHAKQCAEQDVTYKDDYAAAVASLKAGLLNKESVGDPNRCTSFANVIERIRADAQGASEDTHFVIISDMKWSCEERRPAPLYEKGTIIQIADGRTDDKIKVSPLDAPDTVKRIFPNAKVVQGVNAERAVAALMSEVEILTAQR